MAKKRPNRKTVRDAIRASVPDGKLAKAKIVLSDAPLGSQPIGGFTEYTRENGGAVVKVGAPAGDNAFDITVRGHETRHATRHKLLRKKPMTALEAIAGQIIDDVNNESGALPTVRSRGLMRIYQRAHLATAVHDLRGMANKARAVKNGQAPDNVPHRNGQILCAVRVAAMLRNYGLHADGIDERDAGYRGRLKLRNVLGNHTENAIQQIVNLGMKRRQRARAISMLVGLLENEPDEFGDTEPEGEEPREPGDLLAPVDEGDALNGHMKIVDLRPKSVFCAKEKTITRRHAPDGVCLNPARYVNAIVSGISHGLFTRRVRQKPGGTVVIDASGSMGANRDNLSALCATCPTATVAYYSGHDGRGYGTLCIYAYQGKRFAGELPSEHHYGGNGVDLPAVKWMMRLPKPWTLVSDLQFCGGVRGSEEIAHALVERARDRGDLTVYHSLDAAFEAFGGKGELK